MKSVLVVPTIRESNIVEFLERWTQQETWDQIIVVEDNPERSFDLPYNNLIHVSWREIDADLKENSWIISRRDSAIRSYGFLMANRMKADYIFTLDDDCLPCQKDFCATHINQTVSNPRWTQLIPLMRTRGIPYRNLGQIPVIMNVGLWNNVPDLDSIQGIANPIDNFEAPKGNRILPRNQYFPMCGMNLFFMSDISILMYFAPMGLNQPYHRFDDIWCGIIIKRICDHLDLSISCGEPHVEHCRASNAFTNLIKEAPGIEANEKFWTIVDQISLMKQNPKECLLEISVGLQQQSDQYLNRYGKALEIWAGLFQ